MLIGSDILDSVSRRSLSGEDTGIDTAIRSQVISKLTQAYCKAGKGTRHAATEEQKLHQLVMTLHDGVDIEAWQLTLQYEKCMEKHIDLVLSSSPPQSCASLPKFRCRQVLRQYRTHINYALQSQLIPIECKKVLVSIVEVLSKGALTESGLTRVETSLENLKTKIDARSRSVLRKRKARCSDTSHQSCDSRQFKQPKKSKNSLAPPLNIHTTSRTAARALTTSPSEANVSCKLNPPAMDPSEGVHLANKENAVPSTHESSKQRTCFKQFIQKAIRKLHIVGGSLKVAQSE